MEELFEAIREAASRSAWTQGVELARAGAVSGERLDPREAVLRVETRGGLVCPSVRLRLAEADWECECAGTEDPCAHVTAAVIALRQARKAGHDLPRADGAAGRLRYVLSRERGGLALRREVVTDGRAEPLRTTLTALASGRVDGPAFVATPADLAVERALGPRLEGVVPEGVVTKLFEALAHCDDVRLDGEPVRVALEPVGPIAVLEDHGDDFVLRVVPDASVRERFANAVALCGDTLRPLGASRLSGRELEELPRGRVFRAGDVAQLVTEVLPSLRERIPVEVRTTRLPHTRAEPPRLLFETERKGDALSVLPLLVYGSPPLARVDAGQLVPLGSGPIPLREMAEEDRLRRFLARELELAPGRRLELRGAEAIRLAERLADGPWDVRGQAHREFFRAAPLLPRLRLGEADFTLDFETAAAAGAGPEAAPAPVRRADAAAVLGAWRAGESLVPLAGGGFAPLPDDWLGRFGERVADLLAAREAAGRLPASALPDLARLCDALGEPRPPGVERVARLLEDFRGIPEAPLPEDLRATLRSYQRRGVDWLCWLRDAGLGALLADDMGLGKTLQALCALRGRTLVVAPTSVLHGWESEIQRFRPGLRVALHHGPRRQLDPEADVVLTSYAILRLDVELLARERWDAVVLDEAQNIKNADSAVARAAFRLRGDFRLALTGTPVENRLEELWSQLHFLNPGLLGSRRDFEERTARPVADGRPGAAERLRERIRPFVLRRRKADVAPELPPRTDMVLHCELATEERRVYEAVRAATRRDVVERLRAGGNVLAALEALLRLRQAACHPGLVPGQHAETSSKCELLLERLDTVVADGHKALVFSQWTSLLDRVEPGLRRAGIDFLRLDGATRDRAGVVAGFQSEDGPPVLLISLRAGGTGLNLTRADHVFLLDPWWNPAVEDQAADRAHRIGQERPVGVYRLVAEDTVEERILALQERKRELADAALGEAEAAASLTRDDLLALLE